MPKSRRGSACGRCTRRPCRSRDRQTLPVPHGVDVVGELAVALVANPFAQLVLGHSRDAKPLVDGGGDPGCPVHDADVAQRATPAMGRGHPKIRLSMLSGLHTNKCGCDSSNGQTQTGKVDAEALDCAARTTLSRLVRPRNPSDDRRSCNSPTSRVACLSRDGPILHR